MGLLRIAIVSIVSFVALFCTTVVLQVMQRKGYDSRAALGLITVIGIGLVVRKFVSSARTLLGSRQSRLPVNPMHRHALGTAAGLAPGAYDLIDVNSGRRYAGNVIHRFVDYRLRGADRPSDTVPFSDHGDRLLLFQFDHKNDQTIFFNTTATKDGAAPQTRLGQ